LFTADSKLRPYRTTRQNFFHEKMVRRFVDYSYKKAAVTVSVSDFTRQQILGFSPGTRVRTIYNGTELDFFHPTGGRRPPGVGKPLKLLFVGNLIVRKGVDMIPDIMRSLGDGFQLNYTKGLRTHSVLDDIPNARCLGKLDREQMRSAYLDADLLLFPSRMEGLPLAIIEAAACGLPAVTSDASSMPEAVIDRKTGRLCELDNVESFAEAIRELAENPALIEQMGKSARALAENKFDARIMVNNYRLLFEQVVDEST
jgi:glycosyltransferase involved in cell wall biosynthesis